MATYAGRSQEISVKTATIANGASLSDAVDVAGGEVIGIYLPTITSAAITFQASHDGTTFGDLYTSGGSEQTLGAASTGARFLLMPAGISGIASLKVRSGTTGSAVNQGAERLIKLVIKNVS